MNKVSTKVTLWFDVANSASLSQEHKELIISRLGSRVSKEGVLRVISQQTRSQAANREAAVERFVELLRVALKQEKDRKKTRVSAAAKRRRLEEKKQRGCLKRERPRKSPSRIEQIFFLLETLKFPVQLSDDQAQHTPTTLQPASMRPLVC